MAVLVLTPFGVVQLARFGWSKGPGRSGVELYIGSAGGGLLRGFTLRDVSFTAQDGTRFLVASEVGAHLAEFSWGGKLVELDGVRVEGADLLFEQREGGGSVGWSDLRGGSEEKPESGGRPWTIGFDGGLLDVTVEVRRPDTGAHVVVGPAGGTLSGTVADFEAALAGSAFVETRGVTEPAYGSFSGMFRMGPDRTLTVSGLELATNVGEATVDGSVRFSGEAGDTLGGSPEGPAGGPGADLQIESTHSVPQLRAFVRSPGASAVFENGTGRIWLSSGLKGPFTALSYSSQVLAEDVTLGRADVGLLEASVIGDAASLEVRSLHAEAAGGAVDATATLGFAGAVRDSALAGDDATFPHIRADVELSGLDLTRLVEVGREGEARVAGALHGTANMDWKSRGLSNLSAAFDVRVSEFAAGGRVFGTASASGRVTDGFLMSYGDCCDASITAIGQLTDEGLEELRLSADTEDLAALGSVFGADALEGSGTAGATISGGPSALSFSATVDLPDLRFRQIQAGPVRAEATGEGGLYKVLFEAFDSSLLGTATLDTAGRYEASANARSFDLARVVEDSLRETMALAGLVSGSAAVSGTVGGAFKVTGEISALDLAARRQRAELTGPFGFVASRDSISLTEAKLDGTFGEVSVAGSFTTAGALDLGLTFNAAELSEVSDLLPRLLDHPPHGQLAGTVQVEGTRSSPYLSADVSLRDFEMFGLSLDSAVLEATADSSDVVFYVSAESTESGSVHLSGAAPVRPDSLTVWAFDPDREFGMSLASEGFILDAGEPILRGVRGEKRFRLTGSVLLVGTADSLTTITGSGLLSSASASFNLAELALADTVYFEVERGTLEFDRLVVAVTRRQVLGEPAGGTVNASGTVSIDGETSLSASVTDLDLGHLIRALGSAQGSRIRGRLNAEASAEGRGRDMRGRYSWTVESPRLYEVGFDSASGRGSFDSGVFTIESAELRADGSSLGMMGTVTARPRDGTGGASAPPTFDVTVSTDGFRLDRLGALPPGLDELGGRLDIDMRVSGRVDSPDVTGTLKLAGGKLRGFGLTSPVTGIEIEAESSGAGFAVRRAKAKSSGGEIEASAMVELSGGFADPTFLVIGNANSPKFEIEDLAEAKLGGNFSWGGTVSRSELRGTVKVEEAKVTRSFGLGDLMRRSPRVVVIRKADDPRANVKLDLDLEIEDGIDIESNLAKLSVEGGATVGGTMLAPRLSGSFRAQGGTFTYLRNEFTIEELSVDFIEAARRDPYIRLTGVSDVESRTGELYRVTARFNGYLNDAVPELTSVPVLSEGDIASLLTFGDTFGVIVSGDGAPGSSGDNFSNLARRAFLSNAFGLAEKQLERLLDLDRIDIDEEALTSGNAAEADLMLEKEFGSRVRVNYTTSVGRFSNQRVEVSFELMRRLWLQTRTNPEGNHAFGVKLQVPFK